LRLTRSLLAPVDDLVKAAGRVERGELDVGSTAEGVQC
jgi:nitrogen fixation/metabolism regulation signal transduction histidine kinase